MRQLQLLDGVPFESIRFNRIQKMLKTVFKISFVIQKVSKAAFRISIAFQKISKGVFETSRAAFPSLKRRGGCGINQKLRSHRRAADGQVADANRFATHSETALVSDHPSFARRHLRLSVNIEFHSLLTGFPHA